MGLLLLLLLLSLLLLLIVARGRFAVVGMAWREVPVDDSVTANPVKRKFGQKWYVW